jgi:PAS domain S-box-containing protein
MLSVIQDFFQQMVLSEKIISIVLAFFSILAVGRKVISFLWKHISETNASVKKFLNLIPKLEKFTNSCDIETMVGILNRLENGLFHTNQKIQSIIFSMGLASFETDRTGKYTFVSKQWIDLTGLSINEATGNGWINAVQEDFRKEVFSEWESCLLQNREFRMTTKFEKLDREISIVAWPIRNLDGSIEKFFGILI